MRETVAQRRQRLTAAPQDVKDLQDLVDGPLRRMGNLAGKPPAAVAPVNATGAALTPAATGDTMDGGAGALLWFALVALNVARPAGARASLIASVLRGSDPTVGDERTVALLNELARMGLVTLQGPIRGGRAMLTKQGVDVVEYEAAAPASIARPGLG